MNTITVNQKILIAFVVGLVIGVGSAWLWFARPLPLGDDGPAAAVIQGDGTGSASSGIILVGGDAGMGHFFYPHPIPVTETQKHSAYPGCYRNR